jgi:hypothetical protein
MTRGLAITKRQAKTLLKAANEEGGIVEIVTSIGTVRLIPATLVKDNGGDSVDNEIKGHF